MWGLEVKQKETLAFLRELTSYNQKGLEIGKVSRTICINC